MTHLPCAICSKSCATEGYGRDGRIFCRVCVPRSCVQCHAELSTGSAYHLAIGKAPAEWYCSECSWDPQPAEPELPFEVSS